MDDQVRLTQYCRSAGCGCKIEPRILEEILSFDGQAAPSDRLLVGNDSRDDAAVFDLGNGQSIVSTTDFFMPIVDDPFDFGQIASVNAISDIYAMGGKPLMAIAVLGWPLDKLPPGVAACVIEGGRAGCAAAGIPLAGGHSIDSPEPIFGLAVTGQVAVENLKRNNRAVPGCKLFLTKPLGVGLVATAHKRGLVDQLDFERAVECGTDDYIAKPVNKLELLTKVRSLLEHRLLARNYDQLGIPEHVPTPDFRMLTDEGDTILPPPEDEDLDVDPPQAPKF